MEAVLWRLTGSVADAHEDMQRALDLVGAPDWKEVTWEGREGPEMAAVGS